MKHPQVKNLINQIAAQYPDYTPEQVKQVAQNRIQKFLIVQKQRMAVQAAQAAAAAAVSPGGVTNPTNIPTQPAKPSTPQQQQKHF